MKDLETILNQKDSQNIDVFKTKIWPMFEAQKEAEIKGEHEYKYPLCQGKAVWMRAAGNNHLHIWCEGCGFRVFE